MPELLVASGKSGNITFDGTTVVVSAKGGWFNPKLGETRIPVSNISKVNFKQPGIMAGYLHFQSAGEFSDVLLDVAGARNGVTFLAKQAAEFVSLRDAVEQAISGRQ